MTCSCWISSPGTSHQHVNVWPISKQGDFVTRKTLPGMAVQLQSLPSLQESVQVFKCQFPFLYFNNPYVLYISHMRKECFVLNPNACAKVFSSCCITSERLAKLRGGSLMICNGIGLGAVFAVEPAQKSIPEAKDETETNWDIWNNSTRPNTKHLKKTIKAWLEMMAKKNCSTVKNKRNPRHAAQDSSTGLMKQ